ncbi:TPA: hypothetical protein HA225_02555 [Candidatus Micrarchaeota archaeon]|nr:hypothetical protein [Candidatus Micrarchaeota archaeon]
MKELLFVSLVAAMLLFGCAGSEPSQQPPAQAASAPKAPSTGGAAGASTGGNSQQAQPSQGSGQGATQGTSPLDSLMGALGLSNGWKVTYLMTTSATPETSEMTQYIKGTDKFRTDSVTMGIETRSIVLSDNIYICSKDGSWSCLKMSKQDDKGSESSRLNDEIKSNPSKYTVTADGTMQVAGTTATCYKVVSENSTTRYCVSPEGVPLYTKSDSQSQGRAFSSELKATSYSLSVSDADFALPAEPTDLSNLYGGGSTPGTGGGESGDDACSYCNYLTGDQRDQCEAACAG